MFDSRPLAIADVVLLTLPRFGDDRGFFSETWSRRAFLEQGIDVDFVQDSHSLSADKGTLRGLHFQKAPHAQAKLVRVVRGRILDVAVDIRRSSPTFGRHVAVELSRDAWQALYIPVGFAHGFCTLEADTEILYKLGDDYAPDAERGIHFADPALAIDWPFPPETMVMSEKDAALPSLADARSDLFP